MDVTITGRRIQVSDSFREQIAKKMTELDSRVDKVIRAEVQVQAEPRGSSEAVRVEITMIGKGPVVRAEAAADDKTVAFERAFDRLKAQLRKAADRRRSHHNLRAVTKGPSPEATEDEAVKPKPVPVRTVAGLEVQGDGPLVVREKDFASEKLTLAQALDEMELVGHDFFLFVDRATDKPSVVYRRKAYDYGVIRLTVIPD